MHYGEIFIPVESELLTKIRSNKYETNRDTFDVPILNSTLLHVTQLDSSGISDSNGANNVKIVDAESNGRRSYKIDTSKFGLALRTEWAGGGGQQ